MEMKCQSFECMQYSFTGISLGSFVTTVTLYAMLMKHSSFGEKKLLQVVDTQMSMSLMLVWGIKF